MVINFLGLQFSSKLSIGRILRSTFGISYPFAKYLCDCLGVSTTTQIGAVPRHLLREFTKLTVQNRLIGTSLKREKLNHLRIKFQLRLYQGIRQAEGLPSRGQRSRSNASTTRRLKRSKVLLNKV
jgi:small subunit ribosomal protein S13